MKITRIAALILILFACLPRRHEALEPARTPAIVFLSDFGTADDSVAQCKGVMESILPGARVTDMTHDIPPYDIRLAAFYLADSALVWPAGTVFVAVVDPGVGTARKSAALRTKSGHYFVGPDNGVFTLVIRHFGVDKIVSIENPAFARPAVSTTFHGRDVYAPAAAWLARDATVLEKLGPPIATPVLLTWSAPAAGTGTVSGELLRVESPYGNVWTDIEGRTLRESGLKEGAVLAITLGGRVLHLPFVNTFGDVPEGSPLAYINSRGLFSLALNMADFSKEYGVQAGLPVTVRLVRAGTGAR